MELNIAKINIGDMLVLPPDWKGYNFKYGGVWLKENTLNKVNLAYYKRYDPIKRTRVIYGLTPFALVMTAGIIIETFESCPDKENKEKMLISRGICYYDFLEAYLLVGDLLEEYEFDTIKLTDDATHDWHKMWGKI